MNTIARDIGPLVVEKITQEDILVLTGARQTGKTTFCEQLLPPAAGWPYTYVSFDDPDERLRYQDRGIALLEAVETPLLILDEVQKIPAVFEHIKIITDRARKRGGTPRRRTILTGSSQLLLLKNVRESLAGRAALMHLYPFSLSEVAPAPPLMALSKIWEADAFPKSVSNAMNRLSASEIRERMEKAAQHRTWGGFPPVWARTGDTARLGWLKDYRRTYLERDLSDVGQVADLDAFALAQKLLCARTAQCFSLSEVARDLGLAVNTIKRYVRLLELTFQCTLLPPFYENVGKRLIKSPKMHFLDSGLIRAILGDLSVSSGALYESWFAAELLKWKQLQPLEPELYYYRTAAGMEVDFILASNLRLLPIEVKSSGRIVAQDGRGVEAFLLEHRTKASIGIVAYPGRTIEQIRRHVWAIPDWLLF